MSSTNGLQTMTDGELLEQISIASSLDGSLEPSLLFAPSKPKAIVVALHTWSHNRFNQAPVMLPFCREREWALLLPEFRGPNLLSNPRAHETCGSALARRDIVDAALWVKQKRLMKSVPTFLVGGSGGGHMALMVAACENFPWSAISAWCPITDLSVWHGENAGFAPHLEAIFGGSPTKEGGEYIKRSPLPQAVNLCHQRLHVAHGRHDSVVPWSHSQRLAERLIASPQFYFSLFNGGHELRAPEAFAFFDHCLEQSSQNQLSY